MRSSSLLFSITVGSDPYLHAIQKRGCALNSHGLASAGCCQDAHGQEPIQEAAAGRHPGAEHCQAHAAPQELPSDEGGGGLHTEGASRTLRAHDCCASGCRSSDGAEVLALIPAEARISADARSCSEAAGCCAMLAGTKTVPDFQEGCHRDPGESLIIWLLSSVLQWPSCLHGDRVWCGAIHSTSRDQCKGEFLPSRWVRYWQQTGHEARQLRACLTLQISWCRPATEGGSSARNLQHGGQLQ